MAASGHKSYEDYMSQIEYSVSTGDYDTAAFTYRAIMKKPLFAKHLRSMMLGLADCYIQEKSTVEFDFLLTLSPMELKEALHTNLCRLVDTENKLDQLLRSIRDTNVKLIPDETLYPLLRHILRANDALKKKNYRQVIIEYIGVFDYRPQMLPLYLAFEMANNFVKCHLQGAVTFDDIIKIAKADNLKNIYYLLSRSKLMGIIDSEEKLKKLLAIHPNFFSLTQLRDERVIEHMDDHPEFFYVQSDGEDRCANNIVTLCRDFTKLVEYCRDYPDFSLALIQHEKIRALVQTDEQLVEIASYNLQAALEIQKKEQRLKFPEQNASQIALASAAYRYNLFVPNTNRRKNAKYAGDYPPTKTVTAHKQSADTAVTDPAPMVDESDVAERFDRYSVDTFLTTQEFVREMCFGETGYYTTGKVDFSIDFTTNAAYPIFAVALAFQLYANWQKKSESEKADTFHVLECGAGNGTLAYNILDTIKRMAALHPEPLSGWPQLDKNIRYHIVEISPALRKRQRYKTQYFSDKVEIHAGDAMKLSALEPEFKQKVSVAFSNELLDMFPPHELRLDSQRDVQVGIVVPSVTKKDLASFFGQDTKTIDKLIKRSDKHKAIVKKYMPEQKIPDDEILLSKIDFLKLHEIYAKPKFTPDNVPEVFSFRKIYVSQKSVPKVKQFVQDNPEFLKRMQPGNVRYANTGIKDYLAGLNTLMREGGEVTTIDYGDSDPFTQDGFLRVFSYIPGLASSENSTLTPGHRDITYDLNGSTLQSAGARGGYQVLFFGKENQLLPDHILPLFKHLYSESTLAKFKSFDFSVMVQIKSSQPLTRAQIQSELTYRFSGGKSEDVAYSQFFSQDVAKGKKQIEDSQKLSSEIKHHKK
ncbi:MAG: SAM-dependent methyltransferase [Gammaproteobacteria bacterium]